VFDSGVGGLTVLHELLVSLPSEDYVYLGDTANFPYGDKTDAELQQFSVRIADHLLELGVKLIVVACNSAAAAALETLEQHLKPTGVDVIGVIRPAAQTAVVSTSNGRIGLLATPATVNNGAYARALLDADPHVHLESVAAADLATIINEGATIDERIVQSVRAYCAPLRAAAVDTVVLGCTHYPLVAPLLQRSLGRGVKLITSGVGVTRSVERALAAKDLLNPQAGEGSYRFQTTADVESFTEVGVRFLQMPFGEVEHVELGRPTSNMVRT
jgi:glutamate racemase